MPEDLGEPDAAGVYTYSTVTGTLFFRQTQPHPFAAPHWEWSTDKALWIPTSFVRCYGKLMTRIDFLHMWTPMTMAA